MKAPDAPRDAMSRSGKKRPDLAALFAGVTPEMFQSREDIAWLEMPSVGKERL